MVSNTPVSRQSEPDWAHVHRELGRPGVTLALLWEEYRAAEPGGYQYSRWCELYRAWESRLSPTMRQAHPAGERLFVDYAGQTVPVIDAKTGEITPAQIFVAVLGASNYTYAEATATQTLPDWIGAHARALSWAASAPVIRTSHAGPRQYDAGSTGPCRNGLRGWAPDFPIAHW